jgi:hypothetical protein
MFNNSFFRKFCSLCDNVEKYGKAREAAEKFVDARNKNKLQHTLEKKQI